MTSVDDGREGADDDVTGVDVGLARVYNSVKSCVEGGVTS